MNFKFLRGACIVIESKNKRILCDPWLADGEYYGSWAHYPPYDWRDDLSDIDYIYVSHIHPDHFSAPTMARLPKVPVLIHDFQSKFLRKNIEALGFEVRELPHNQEVDLGGIIINIIAADDCDPAVCQKFFGCSLPEVATTQIDSMAIFRDDKHVYANVNDCPYQLSRNMLPKVRLQYPEIDVLFVAYAGAGPYPQCFVMDEELKQKAAQIKKYQFIHHAAAFAGDLKAKQTFPFAGDYMLCGKFAKLNQYRGVATLREVYSYFDMIRIPVLKTDIPDEKAREIYMIDHLRARKMDYEDDPETRDLEKLLVESQKRLEAKVLELGLQTNTSIYINNFHVHGTSDNYVKMTVDNRLLARILRGPKYAHWNNAEIGSHIMFDRKPDVFERGIHHLMSFFHI